MRNTDILGEISSQRQAGHQFIKWWRREHDFLNFELLDNFEQRTRSDEAIKWLEGFELLDTEEMWKELHHRFPNRVKREKRRAGEVLVWNRKGEEHVCTFSPENIMKVFEVETRGNVIDS